MLDLVTRRRHRIAPQLLRNALTKAEVAQFQLWDSGAGSGSLGLRQIESLASILMAWVAIEGMVNEAVHEVFPGAQPPVPRGQGTQENKLRECLRARVGSDNLGEWEPALSRLMGARRFRNSLVHYSPHESPAELGWEGRVIGDNYAVGWMLAAPPTTYKEGLAERIDPEQAWEFCSGGILVATAVYKTLALDPDLGGRIAASKIPPEFLPKHPVLDDLMNGIPLYQLERYWRALRVAEQYTEQWWVLQADGRRRPYRPSEDLKRDTMLTAFEGEPTEEKLGEWWADYCDSIPPVAVPTKRVMRNASGQWTLVDPAREPLFDLRGDDGGDPASEE
jgi:hypothetical protein